ncbi:hypothetical protein U8Q02_02370 [Rhizobium leguminosarum]|nr:hypothetical protein U8Q02_02370 [Rhizobium leguminosarum]
MEIFRGIDPRLFPESGNISKFALEQIAKAEPDIQALIAERVEAGRAKGGAWSWEFRHVDRCGISDGYGDQDKNRTVRDLRPTVLYALAAPSMTKAALRKAVNESPTRRYGAGHW